MCSLHQLCFQLCLYLQVAMTRLNVRIREKLFHSLMQQEAG